jgi:hypothetical protein
LHQSKELTPDLIPEEEISFKRINTRVSDGGIQLEGAVKPEIESGVNSLKLWYFLLFTWNKSTDCHHLSGIRTRGRAPQWFTINLDCKSTHQSVSAFSSSCSAATSI